MNLIFLYGPPAVGKLTVARELVKLTGYKLFHNHLSVDMVTSIFVYDSREFYELLDSIRVQMFEQAAKSEVDGVVFTFVYDAAEDEVFIKKVEDAIKKYGGNLFLVRLSAPKEVLEERLKNESRKEFKKTTSKDVLNAILDNFNTVGEPQNYTSLSIDTNNNSAEESAKKIAEYYHLIHLSHATNSE